MPPLQVSLHPTGQYLDGVCPHCRTRGRLAELRTAGSVLTGAQRIYECPSCRRISLTSGLATRAGLGLFFVLGIVVMAGMWWLGVSMFWPERELTPGVAYGSMAGLSALVGFPIFKLVRGLRQVVSRDGLRKLRQGHDGVHRLEGEA